MIVNMGPQHPSMHGVLRLILTLDSEDVIDCEPILGYLHRGMEKIAENRTIIQYLPYVTRWDYLATMFTEAITVNAPEKLGNIQVPKRASYIRVIMLELSRIASHLLWLGPFRQILWIIMSVNDEFDWEVEWQKEGDSLARYLVRLGEMTESIKIIQQALEGIPGGPYENLEIRRFDKVRDAEWHEFEYRFIKELYVRVEAPKGELGIFLIGDQSVFPWRWKIRPPGFINLQILPQLVKKMKLADIMTILGSIDIIMGEVDR
uniref:NADH-quinone oxidoreductase subunit D domain-containing protein n=1 Tax=Populus tomentosa TaxID=118781 RepID=A0A1L6K557_POPTO|nr:hypothetical protein [Populus tomentosa]